MVSKKIAVLQAHKPVNQWFSNFSNGAFLKQRQNSYTADLQTKNCIVFSFIKSKLSYFHWFWFVRLFTRQIDRYEVDHLNISLTFNDTTTIHGPFFNDFERVLCKNNFFYRMIRFRFLFQGRQCSFYQRNVYFSFAVYNEWKYIFEFRHEY